MPLSTKLIKLLERSFRCRIFRNSLPCGVDPCFDIKRLGSHFSPRCIFDVGANIGQTAAMFAKEFPQAEIYSFEPVSSTFRDMELNTKHLSKVKRFRLGLGSIRGTREIYLSSMSLINSLVPELNVAHGPEHPHESIALNTVDEFCDEQRVDFIDLLKIDTEGFDLEVIKGAERMLAQKKVHFILAEVGFDESNKRFILLEDLRRHLRECGFALGGLYDQATWPERPSLLYCNALFVNNEFGKYFDKR